MYYICICIYIYTYVPGSRFASSPPPNGMVPQEPLPASSLPRLYLLSVPIYNQFPNFLKLETKPTTYRHTTPQEGEEKVAPQHQTTGAGGIGRCY